MPLFSVTTSLTWRFAFGCGPEHDAPPAVDRPRVTPGARTARPYDGHARPRRQIPEIRRPARVNDMRPYATRPFAPCGPRKTWGLSPRIRGNPYLACPARRRPAVARETRYVFVHVPRRSLFGFEEVVVLGRRAPMASAERALLDALDRPAYAGGIGEVSGMIARAGEKLSWSALAGLVRRWGSSTLARRLGYFLDLHRVDGADGARAELLRTARPASRILLGPRRKWGVRGALVRPWNVVANVPLDVLASAEDRPRRRVLLPRIRR